MLSPLFSAPLFFILFLEGVISVNDISDHVSTANFIARFKDILTVNNLSFSEKRSLFIMKVLEDEKLRKLSFYEAQQLGFMNQDTHTIDTFPCKNYSVSGSGTNINNLTPGDISVIASLGDSITAGVGIDAKTIIGVLWENKGKVFDIGGIDTYQTLTNFIRNYNPNVKGFSMKKTFIKSKIDGLNVAVSGATSRDLMSQVDTLISKMKTSESIDFEKDWKLINIFIGNNDICRSCEEENAPNFTPELFKERLLDALDKLKEQVPRAFVSLITMLDVYEVHNLNKGVICSMLHLYECRCVAYPSDIEDIIKVNDEFQNVIAEIGKSDRYNDKDNFAVVAQPFFEETNIPYVDGNPDLSYFSPDCFHFSAKGHGQVALSLWNSLFEPIATKKNHWFVGEKFQCPSTERPFLATENNAIK